MAIQDEDFGIFWYFVQEASASATIQTYHRFDTLLEMFQLVVKLVVIVALCEGVGDLVAA